MYGITVDMANHGRGIAGEDSHLHSIKRRGAGSATFSATSLDERGGFNQGLGDDDVCSCEFNQDSLISIYAE